ncbi:ABC transporter ATP-binding protein [Bradyrhizobium sp. UNPA324]|uniref:ATP-binding cassette domain-containing protein n=1 Tax=Bradyrhizobium sp. UNPA324 TaxID=1141174 RepID=UPI001AED7F28|nr:ABC transporter ATP-binding protein [Bradyrhizobium sp. UNPA324]
MLDHLSLEAPSGQRIALVGSNGAGKTSLFRSLLGEYSYHGSISIDGLDPRRDRARLLRMIGFVPQIAPRLETPTGAFIRYVAEVSGASVEEIEGVAKSLGLDVAAVRNRAFVRLSGGMKQKLLIALALGRPTGLLILDEPTANLDPAARAVFYDLLAARGRHTAMIISSHRIDEIAPLVDRVVELDRGRIVLDDTVTDAGALGSSFLVEVETNRVEASFARAAGEWGLTQFEGHRWRGAIAGPDRLRFLGFVARHAGLLSGVELREADRESVNADTLSA